MGARATALSLAAVIALAFSTSAVRAVDVTACGQVVPRGQVAVLVGDLDCSHPDPCVVPYVDQDLPNCVGVRLENGAKLQLGGYTLLGPWPTTSRIGVDCNGNCRVVGPGTITGFSAGILAHKYKGAELIPTTAKVTDVAISNIGDRGIDGKRVRVTGCTVSGVGHIGIGGRHIKVRDSSVSDGAQYGIKGGRLNLRNVSVTGNGKNGVWAVRDQKAGGKLVARDGVIAANAIDCPPDEPRCVDILAEGKMRLQNTTYDTCWPVSRCP